VVGVSVGGFGLFFFVWLCVFGVVCCLVGLVVWLGVVGLVCGLGVGSCAVGGGGCGVLVRCGECGFVEWWVVAFVAGWGVWLFVLVVGGSGW